MTALVFVAIGLVPLAALGLFVWLDRRPARPRRRYAAVPLAAAGDTAAARASHDTNPRGTL